MRISISNIAWNLNEDMEIAKLLQKCKVDAIDIAPMKYFPEPEKTTINEIAAVKNWWSSYGIEIIGMQALFFGTKNLNIFHSSVEIFEHLTAICRIGSTIGAKRLVFGSPKNRDRSGLNDQDTINSAVIFFQKLGDIAQSHGVIICLEPNPVHYGANFMTTAEETAQIVGLTSHPAIKMQIDTGALSMNCEDIHDILEKYSSLIGHIHISEPNLVSLEKNSLNHLKINDAFIKFLPNYVASIEMLPTQSESKIQSIENSIKIAKHYYGKSVW